MNLYDHDTDTPTQLPALPVALLDHDAARPAPTIQLPGARRPYPKKVTLMHTDTQPTTTGHDGAALDPDPQPWADCDCEVCDPPVAVEPEPDLAPADPLAELIGYRVDVVLKSGGVISGVLAIHGNPTPVHVAVTTSDEQPVIPWHEVAMIVRSRTPGVVTP